MKKKTVCSLTICLIICVLVSLFIVTYVRQNESDEVITVKKSNEFSFEGTSVLLPDNLNLTVPRERAIEISEVVEKYIKDTYDFDVNVKEIVISGSFASSTIESGGMPNVIGSHVTIIFENNKYISALSQYSMFVLSEETLPEMNVWYNEKNN